MTAMKPEPQPHEHPTRPAPGAAPRRFRLPAALLTALLLTVGLAAPGAAQNPEDEQPSASVQQPAATASDDGAGTGEAPSPPASPAADDEGIRQPGDALPEDTDDDLELFVDRIDVRVVNVDVYVTDKDGKRVTGLTKDDFELFEDKKPVDITNFYAVEGGEPVAEPASARVADLETGQAPAPQPIETTDVPPEQRLFLVVYIDNFNIRPVNRNRVIGELGYFLSTELDRDDQVMLVTYDRSLHVRRPFTADPDLVARSLEEVARTTGHAVSRDDAREKTLERITRAQTENQALVYARMHAEEMQNDLRFTVGALKEMISDLAGLPGRKAILYVSDGVPMVPGQDVFHAVQGKFGASSGFTDSFQYDASREFTEIANLANANRVTFYTVDAAGLRIASTFTAEHAGPSLGISVDSAYNANNQSPLRYMAETTGGEAILNTNRVLPGLKQVAEDFSTYYSLGYSPRAVGSGRYHRIEVKVKGRKDLQVRHREGYRDKTVEAQMVDGTVSALHFGFRDNPLGVKLGFGTPSPREGRHLVVPLQVEIPLSEVVLVPATGTYESRVRIYVSALDSQGDSSPVQQIPVQISIPEAEYERALEQRYRYTVPLLMRRGVHHVAVGVRDEIASKESFVVEDVDVDLPGAQRKGG
jgi:VWFA-related protein